MHAQRRGQLQESQLPSVLRTFSPSPTPRYTLKHEDKGIDEPGVWITYGCAQYGKCNRRKAAFSI